MPSALLDPERPEVKVTRADLGRPAPLRQRNMDRLGTGSLPLGGRGLTCELRSEGQWGQGVKPRLTKGAQSMSPQSRVLGGAPGLTRAVGRHERCGCGASRGWGGGGGGGYVAATPLHRSSEEGDIGGCKVEAFCRKKLLAASGSF